ncbi:hypothetical protein L0Y40_02270 [Candidatus Wolfebacteria bacterium]|nr:hypothetical protein [Candidatus Wolfebacteria bacterium]
MQNRPESTRRHFAFVASLLITLAIVGVWLTTIPSRTSLERRVRVENTDVTPLRSLTDSFSGLFSNVPEHVKNFTGMFTQPAPVATSTGAGLAKPPAGLPGQNDSSTTTDTQDTATLVEPDLPRETGN